MTASARTVSQISVLALAVSCPRRSNQGSILTYHTEFAQGKVDPTEAGKEGGHSSGGSGDSSSGSGNSGGSGKGQFAGGKVDPVEAGKKGGATQQKD